MLPGQDADGASDYDGKDLSCEGHLPSATEGCPGKGWASQHLELPDTGLAPFQPREQKGCRGRHPA